MENTRVETVFSIERHSLADFDLLERAKNSLDIVEPFPLRYVSHTVMAIPIDDDVYCVAEVQVSFPEERCSLTDMSTFEGESDFMLTQIDEHLLEYRLIHSSHFTSSLDSGYDNTGLPVGALVFESDGEIHEVYPAISGVCDILYGLEKNMSQDVAPSLWNNDFESVTLEAEFVHHPWFGQRENQHIVCSGMRTGTFVDIQLHLAREGLARTKLDKLAKPKFIMIRAVKVELMELVCFPPLLSGGRENIHEGKKFFRSTTLLEKECFNCVWFDDEPFYSYERGDLYQLSIPTSVYDCELPSVPQTSFSSTHTRNYAIKFSFKFEGTHTERLDVVLNLQIARADDDSLVNVFRQGMKRSPSRKAFKAWQCKVAECYQLPEFRPLEIGNRSLLSADIDTQKVVYASWVAHFTDQNIFLYGSIATKRHVNRVIFNDGSFGVSHLICESNEVMPPRSLLCFVEKDKLHKGNDLILRSAYKFLSPVVSKSIFSCRRLMALHPFNYLVCVDFKLQPKKPKLLRGCVPTIVGGMMLADIVEPCLRIPKQWRSVTSNIGQGYPFFLSSIHIFINRIKHKDGASRVIVKYEKKRKIMKKLTWHASTEDNPKEFITVPIDAEWYNDKVPSLKPSLISKSYEATYEICFMLVLRPSSDEFSYKVELQDTIAVEVAGYASTLQSWARKLTEEDPDEQQELQEAQEPLT